MKKLSNIICVFILISVLTVSVNAEKNDQVIYNSKNDEMKIALTFDDGPHPTQTLKILDILDKYNIKATFFAIGVNIDNYEESIKKVAARGHEIGNHTNTHPKISNLSYNDLKNEFTTCKEKIEKTCNIKTKLMRPPEGSIGKNVTDIANELDCKVILWDIDTKDWAHTSPENICKNVISNIKSGDIILMHDYIGRNSPTAQAIELFIPKLIAKGFRFVTISELIEN